MKGFSILIPTWNNLKHLKLLVHSIEKNSYYDHEIIVHIQEGVDGTLEWCKKNNIIHTHSPCNIGISAAVNISFGKATREWVCHMDDDIYACPDWDKYLLDFVKENELGKNAWVSSARIEPKGNNPFCIAPHQYGSVDEFEENRLLEEYTSYEIGVINNTQSNPLLIHRSLWSKMKGADEKYFGPGFEEGLSKNAWDAGCRTFVQVPNSRVFHFQSTSTSKLNRQNPGYFQAQRDMDFFNQHGITIKEFNKDYIKRGTEYINEISK